MIEHALAPKLGTSREEMTHRSMDQLEYLHRRHVAERIPRREFLGRPEAFGASAAVTGMMVDTVDVGAAICSGPVRVGPKDQPTPNLAEVREARPGAAGRVLHPCRRITFHDGSLGIAGHIIANAWLKV